MSHVELLEWIETSALVIEVVALAIMFASIMISTAIYLATLLRQRCPGWNLSCSNT